MQKMKKALVLVFALTMVLAPALEANAGSITIQAGSSNVSLENVDFNAYLFYSLEIVGTVAEEGYVYRIADEFAAFAFTYDFDQNSGTPDTTIGGDALRQFLSGLPKDDNNNISDADVVMALTAQLRSYILGNGIQPTETATGTGGGSVEITNLANGYYVVMPDQNSDIAATPILTMLTVGNDERTATIKTDVPTIQKKVYNNPSLQMEGETEYGWGDAADYGIGATIPFMITANLPNLTGYRSYQFIVTDRMSEGLTFDEGSLEVLIDVNVHDDDNELYSLQENISYTYTVNDIAEQGTEIVISIDENFLFENNFEKSPYALAIIIQYNAVLNEKAVIADATAENPQGNPNTVYLEYSNNPYETGETGKTPEDTVIVYTFDFEVVKVNGAGELLQGAKFVLCIPDTSVGGPLIHHPVCWYITLDENGFVTGKTMDVRDLAETSNIENAIFTIPADGSFAIKGLAEGMYYLREVEAPAGYNKLTHEIQITVDALYHAAGDGISAVKIIYGDFEAYTEAGPEVWGVRNPATATDEQYLNSSAQVTKDKNQLVDIVVVNNTGVILPETGGIGTTIFTVTGILLMVGAAVILIAKKKVSIKD